MQIWLESVDIPLIVKAESFGILQGIATNSTLIAKSKESPKDLIQELLKAQRGCVAIELKTGDAPSMIAQAKELLQLSDKIVVKVPTTKVGLEVIHALSGKVPTIASGIFDFNQALLASKGGASYIAPDYSWICESDIAGIHTIRAMLDFLKRYGLSSQMIASGLNSPEQVKELAEMGAHAASMSETVFKGLTEDHPQTLSKKSDE